MAISRTKKEEVVREVGERLRDATVVFLVDYTGVKTPKVNELRRALRQLGVHYQVIKKTLAELAFRGSTLDFSHVAGHAGSLALITAKDNELGIAKLIFDFKRDNDTFDIVGGFLNHNFLPRERVAFLARIPSRDVLLAQLVGVFAGPLRGLVTVLAGDLQKLVLVLKAIERSTTKNV